MEITTDRPAKIIINERTGTVVIGENVRIASVAIAHGNLSIEIKEEKRVSQPAPFLPETGGGEFRLQWMVRWWHPAAVRWWHRTAT